jgi:hypothetical protein
MLCRCVGLQRCRRISFGGRGVAEPFGERDAAIPRKLRRSCGGATAKHLIPARISAQPAHAEGERCWWRSSTPIRAAAKGSARLSVPAVVARTRTRPAVNSLYAAAVVARPSQAIKARVVPSRRGVLSLIIQGSRGSEPSSRESAESVGRSAARFAAASCLAKTVYRP